MKKILCTVLAGIGLMAATAQEPIIKQKTVNVTGVAEMEVVPDEIYVQVVLKEYDKKTVKVDIEKIKNDFLQACKTIGLTEKDISVQSYSGYDGNAWVYKKNKKKDPDMKASITYSIKLSTTRKMDELVEKMDDEATQSFNISRVSHSKLEEFKKQVKIQAIKAAKDKAVYLSEAIGEQVAGALTINDINDGVDVVYPQARMFSNMAVAEVADAPMNVDFKKIKLQFSVSVVFLLK